MKTNEYLSAIKTAEGWKWTAPSRLHPGTRTASIHARSTKRAALAAARREFPGMKVVE